MYGSLNITLGPIFNTCFIASPSDNPLLIRFSTCVFSGGDRENAEDPEGK